MVITEYLNPFDQGFYRASESFQELRSWQKLASVIASVVAGILTPFLAFTGAFAAFRWTVEVLTDHERHEGDTPEAPSPLTPETLKKTAASKIEIPEESEPELSSVKTLMSQFDPLWNEEIHRYENIPFDQSKSLKILEAHNRAFENFQVDEETNYGMIYKQDLPENTKIFVRADLHGDLKSLMENLKELQKQGLLNTNYKCAADVQLVFLGDYMDRGDHSIEVAMILASLRMENPKQVHLIRGNHESTQTNELYCANDAHMMSFTKSEKAMEVLDGFYRTMPLTIYMALGGSDVKEYVQFTHGLFEVEVDPATILDSDHPRAQMEIPRDLSLSERIKALSFDPKANYVSQLLNASSKEEKKRIRLAHAAQRIHHLALLAKKGDREGYEDNHPLTAYNWADVGSKTELVSMGNREWKLSPRDIKHAFRIASTQHKVKMVMRGHEHQFKHHQDGKKKVLVSTLPVGMDSAGYMHTFKGQLDRAYILDVKPRVKEWTKRAYTRESNSSTTITTETVELRNHTV